LPNDLAWCYRAFFGLAVHKFDDILSGILLLRHAIMLSKFIKEIVGLLTSPELCFSERVVNVWNQLPVSTDIRSLSLFMRGVYCMGLPCYLHIQFWCVLCVMVFMPCCPVIIWRTKMMMIRKSQKTECLFLEL